MPSVQTDIQQQAASRTQPDLPTGVQVYDAIMRGIEPELLSANLAHLDDAYTQETPDQHAERYKRYTAAFARYDDVFEQWKGRVHAESAELRRHALEKKEQQSRSDEASILTDLEQRLSDTPSSSSK